MNSKRGVERQIAVELLVRESFSKPKLFLGNNEPKARPTLL